MLTLLICFGAFFALGAFFIFADLLRVPSLAGTKAVLTVTNQSKARSKGLEALIFDLSVKLSRFIRLDVYKRRKLEAQLKSADIKMTAETYTMKAWVKSGLVALLAIPLMPIIPILAPVVLFLAIAIYFREVKAADDIVKEKRDEIEYELPRFVSTISQELKSSRDVLSILKAYQRNAGKAIKWELEITIADMASGNEETALTRLEARIGSTMLSDVVRGLISVMRGDDGIMYFEMLTLTFRQLELQRLKLLAMKQPGKMRKYSFFLLACFLLIYLGILGYAILQAFGNLF